ncbi:MAG: DUF1080 domain-containing protein [Planctomycetes bacterium]|nr:DUF1080 domain-containing protein [Planctomycetota bacterium]
MKPQLFALAIGVVSLLARPTSGQVGAPASGPGWTPLFDAKSIDGWVKRGGAAEYRVEDGCIVGVTHPDTPNTFLCSPREYADFILEYEFKADPKLNSGVQIRSGSFPGYRNGVVHGYQVEIDPSERAFSAGIYDESRRGWLADLKDNEAARKAFRQNEWNRVRVEAMGDTIRTWINGVAAANVTDGLTRRGFIGLQVHGTDSKEPLEVRWRDLRIQERGDPLNAMPMGATVLLGRDASQAAWESAAKPGQPADWTVVDGALEVRPGAGDIMTKKLFGSVRLHLEFCVDDNGKEGQANGNSGIYIQRRYEVQVLNSAGQEPSLDNCGAIYKVKAPDYNVALPAGQWQTYDIWFYAAKWLPSGDKLAKAKITVYQNGTRIHENVEIPDKTGGGQPELPGDGPLLLQDHGNNIRYRNIWIAPLHTDG